MLARILVALAVLFVLAGVSSGPDVIVGTALVSGPVFLNGHQVSASAVVTSGDRLETGAKGSVTVNLSPRDRLQLSGGSAMILRTRPGGVWADLQQGKVLVSTSHDRLREVRLAEEAISIRATPGTARRYQVARMKDATYVLASVGNITIFDEGYGRNTEVPEGMAGMVRPEAEAPVPQQPPASAPTPSGKRAGQITAIVPVDFVVRGTGRTPGNKGDAILWNDKVETEKQGRARVVLDDGSILSIGSESSLHVVQHDAKTQQTGLTLTYGRMRAQVVKLAKINSSFEVRTNTAICGVLGTDFALEVDATKTKLVVFKGKVSFRPIIGGVVAAAATAAVTVLAGQTSTAVAGAVATPVSSGVTSATSAIASTAVGQQAATTAASTVVVTTATAATAGAASAIATSTKPSPQDTGTPPVVAVSPARP